MASSGTIFELSKKLANEKGVREIHVGINHNLCRPSAKKRLEEMHRSYKLKRLIITDSIPQTEDFRALSFIKICGLADIMARTINRIHYNRSVSEIFYRPV